MDITPAQRKFLSEAANNWLGVAKLYDLHGLARRSRRQMAETLCGYGLMEIYTYGRNEYRITKKGRAALSAPYTDAKVRG